MATIVFEDRQPHQLEALSSLATLFEGQPKIAGEFALSADSALRIHANDLRISRERVLANFKKTVATYNDSHPTSLPLVADGLADGPACGLEFSVEQETGTGKTYVYLRTILELYQRYGFSKFVIFVPSIAIKEGVQAAAMAMENHFKTLYGEHVRLTAIEGANQATARTFAESSTLQVLLVMQQAVDRSSNLFHRKREALEGHSAKDVIAATQPIVILDEPQRMEGDAFTAALRDLNPLAVFRFSATHKTAPNMTYRLGPKEAFEQNLVKPVAVWATEDQSLNKPAVRFLRRSGKKKVVVELLVQGKWVQFTMSPGHDCDLQDATRDDAYFGWALEDFALDGKGLLVTVRPSESRYELLPGKSTQSTEASRAVMRKMVFDAVKELMRKEDRLRPKGIKPLAVFFVPAVSAYDPVAAAEAGVEPLVRTWVEQAYQHELKLRKAADADRYGYLPSDAASVHAGYFARYKGRASELNTIASKDRQAAEKEAMTLILREKQRLMSLDEPVRFIVSHSALREGWDNPNVFVIALLNGIGRDIGNNEGTRRQEIGRGLRLPVVPATGLRISGTDEDCELTVVVPENFDAFVEGLQRDFGLDGSKQAAGPKVRNARARRTVNLKTSWDLDPKFLEVWSAISKMTRYSVEFDSEALANTAAVKFQRTPRLIKPEIITRRSRLDSTLSATVIRDGLAADAPIEVWRNPVTEVSSRTGTTPGLVASVIKRSGRLSEYLVNPDQFIAQLADAVRDALDELLVHGVVYEKLDKCFEQRIFESLEGLEVDDVGRTTEEKSVMKDGLVPLDGSSPEHIFLETHTRRDGTQFIVKLPPAFKIRTPIGTYNPDWALLVSEESASRLVLVKETKSSIRSKDLRGAEKLKIEYGRRHFEAIGVHFEAEAVSARP